MFNRKFRQKAEGDISYLQTQVRQLEGRIIGIKEDIDKKIERLKFDFEKSENAFRKEIIDELTEKYFCTLERIFRASREISLISTLANQVNGKDMANLRSQLLQPFLEARWMKEKEEKGGKIVNKGTAIIEAREKLYEDIIAKERHNEKPEKLELLKAKLQAYDEILEGIK